MTRSDKIALALSLLTVIVTGWISLHIFEGIAHLEDEFAYIWQAQVMARGELTTPTPPDGKSFLVPFVIDHAGQRFGKYPLGWPAMLSLGERIGLRGLVNPLLAGLAVWLTYRLGQKTLGATVGLIAAGLTLTSPFFLMNAGALLSHVWGLALTIGFALAWLDATGEADSLPGWLPTITAAVTLGVLALSRPFTALGVALPFGIHGVILLLQGTRIQRQRIITIGMLAGLVSSLHLLWQYQVTGNPFTNPYTLWWAYDRVGFGPGYGVTAGGHSLKLAQYNLAFSLKAGVSDLFGWPRLSWLFLPFGFAALKKNRAWLPISIFFVLLVFYLGYWIGAWVLGPRYYFEGLISLTLLSAAGIGWLVGWPTMKASGAPQNLPVSKKIRPWGVTALVLLLAAGNLIFYTPQRIGAMKGLFGTSRTQLDVFLKAAEVCHTPALIVVDTEDWRAYAGLLELAHPMLDSDFIFIWQRGPRSTQTVIAAFPERQAYLYLPGEPGELIPLED